MSLTGRRGFLLITLVLLATTASLLLTGARAEAASNGTWSVYPTTSPGHRARVVFTFDLAVGKTLGDSVTVANISSTPQSFLLYSADAFNTPGGGLSLSRRVDPVQGMGAWIHLAHSSVSVPAHSSVNIPFLLVVPVNASPGDHLGGIVAEETTGTTSEPGSVPINVVQAVGVRVYGRIRGTLSPRLAVSPPRITVAQSLTSLFGGSVEAKISFQVSNRGNVVLTPRAVLRVTSTIGGSSTHRYELGPLLPGESVVQVHSVGVSATGRLSAGVTVTSEGAIAKASSSSWLLPWALIGAAAVAVGLIVLVLWRWGRRRRSRRTDAAPGETLTPAVAGQSR